MPVKCETCNGTGGENHDCPTCGGIGERELTYTELCVALHYVLAERDELEARLDNAQRDIDSLKRAS